MGRRAASQRRDCTNADLKGTCHLARKSSLTVRFLGSNCSGPPSRARMSVLGQRQTSPSTNDYVSSEPVSGRLSGARSMTAKGQRPSPLPRSKAGSESRLQTVGPCARVPTRGRHPVTSCAREQPYAPGIVIRHGLQLQRPGGAIFHGTRRAQKERVRSAMIAL